VKALFVVISTIRSTLRGRKNTIVQFDQSSVALSMVAIPRSESVVPQTVCFIIVSGSEHDRIVSDCGNIDECDHNDVEKPDKDQDRCQPFHGDLPLNRKVVFVVIPLHLRVVS
jgi:hypothetical protein